MHEIGAFLLAQATTPPAPTEVVVPWGSWIIQVLDVLQPMVLLALTGVTTYIMGAFVPPWIKAFAGQAAQNRINQVLEKAVLSAIAQTREAVAGKRTTIPVASEILSRAAQYAVDQAPDLVEHATRGELDNLLKMILARMEALHVAPDNFDLDQAKNTFPVDISKQFGEVGNMIEVVVVYCMTINPTMCRTLTVAPVDHAAVSIPECIKGGANYAATEFRLEHADWFVKGWHCHEREGVVQTWLDRHREGD